MNESEQTGEERTKKDLVEENMRLKQKIHNLEETITELEKQLEEGGEENGGDVSGMIKVLKRKDETLDKYAKKLEKSNRKLKETVKELEQKNRELETSTATLRMYEKIFEQDPNILIGVDDQLNIIHFNNAAVDFFGSELHSLRATSVDHLPEEKINGIDIKSQVSSVMEGNETQSKTFTPAEKERKHLMLITPITNNDKEIRAVLIRIRPTGGADQ